MNINGKKQSQFELFPGSGQDPVENERIRPRFSFTNLTLTLENLVVVSIAMVMLVVVFYAFGVQRGKMASFEHIEATEKKSANFSESAIIIESSEPEQEAAQSAEILERDRQETIEEEKIEIIDLPEYLPAPEIVSKNYTIQVASFKLDKSAQNEAKVLEKKGHDISVLRKGNYSIVCVGKFPDKNEAKQYSAKLKKRYKDLLVRRL